MGHVDSNSLLKGFDYHLRIERGLSPNTSDSYCSDVRAFLESQTCSDPEKSGPEEIESFLEERSDFLSKRSQARVLSSLRSFFDWMILDNLRSENPCDRIDAPKLGRYLPEVLSEEEVSAIIESVSLKDWKGLRDRAILEVLYGCGLRVSEACGLRISQVYLEEGFVRVVGKGDKERLVPMGEMASGAFASYLDVRPQPAAPAYEDYAFLNRFGKPLSRVSVFKMIKAQALSAGVTREISPHTFRHSFATHLMEHGADLRSVQEMLGHESILTTEIYTHIDKMTWQNSILSHHPRK